MLFDGEPYPSVCNVLLMPRFFFHLCDECGVILDPQGEELTSLNAARMRAMAMASQLIIDDLKKTGTVRRRHIEITDVTGQLLATVPLLRQQTTHPEQPALLGAE